MDGSGSRMSDGPQLAASADAMMATAHTWDLKKFFL